jgi:hypothetical protein
MLFWLLKEKNIGRAWATKYILANIIHSKVSQIAYVYKISFVMLLL